MSVKRKTIKHSLIYSVADLLGKLVSFLMLPFYARIFNTDGYGIVALVDSTIGLLSIAFAGCAYNSIMRIYHDEPAERKPLAVGTALWTMTVMSLVCIPIPVICSPWISTFLLGDSSHWPVIVVALLTFVIGTAGSSAGTFLIIRQQSTLYSSLGLLNMVLGLGLNIFFVLWLQVGVIGVFLSSMTVSIIGTAIVYYAAIREFGLKYDAEIGRKLRSFWFPLIPGEIFAYVSRQAERYLVRFMIGIEGVGILEMGYKFAPLINIVISHPFMRAWGTKSMEIGSDSEAPQEIASTFTLYLFMVLFGAVMLAANIDEVLALLTPPQFWSAVSIARIETVTTVIVASWNYLQFGLLYKKLTSTISRIRIITAIFKILLSTLLVSVAGLAGAAYSALLMQIIITSWTFTKAQQAYRLPLEYRKIAVLIVAAVAVVWLADGPWVRNAEAVHWLSQAISTYGIALLQVLNLADWHSGKLVTMLTDHALDMAHLTAGGTVCLLYLVMVLVVFPHWVTRLRYKVSGGSQAQGQCL